MLTVSSRYAESPPDHAGVAVSLGDAGAVTLWDTSACPSYCSTLYAIPTNRSWSPIVTASLSG